MPCYTLTHILLLLIITITTIYSTPIQTNKSFDSKNSDQNSKTKTLPNTTPSAEHITPINPPTHDQYTTSTPSNPTSISFTPQIPLPSFDPPFDPPFDLPPALPSNSDSIGWAPPQVFMYVHPWGQKDKFLSVDCMIRTSSFSALDTYSFVIRPRMDRYNDLSNRIGMFGERYDPDNDWDPTQQTPFNKVEVTPFTNGKQCAPLIIHDISPLDTVLDKVIIPFPNNIKLENTENWLNFRFLDPDHELHDVVKLIGTFTYTTMNPSTGSKEDVNVVTNLTQKTALADEVRFENFRLKNREKNDFSIRNSFEVSLIGVKYRLKTLTMALHGNLNLDGSFTTCLVNNQRIDSAYAMDVGVNLTVSNTPLGLDINTQLLHSDLFNSDLQSDPHGNYVISCPDAYISALNTTSFTWPTVLSISGQDYDFSYNSDLYPAMGLVIDGLKYQLMPNYSTYWITIIALVIASSVVSVLIVQYWAREDKHVIVS